MLDASGRVVGVVTLKSLAGESLTFSVPIRDLIVAADRAAAAATHRPEQAAATEANPLAMAGLPVRPMSIPFHQFRIVRGVQVLEGSSLYTVKELRPDRVTVAHRGWLTTRHPASTATPRRSPAPESRGRSPSSSTGSATSSTGKGKRPVGLLGDLSTLILEPLPGAGRPGSRRRR